MPTLVNDDGTPSKEEVADAAVSSDTTAAMAPPAPPPAPASSSKSKGKRRVTSPTPSDPNSATANANQAIAAANLAAAVQMAASLQMNGLLSLLTQSSTPGAASAADPTVLQTTNLHAASGRSNGTNNWQVPQVDQVRQAALKWASDIPPFVHLSKTDSAPQLKILENDRLSLKGGMRGYRMSRATHGVSQGCYYFEVLVQDPPSIEEIVNSLPPNARLGATLQKQIQQALEYSKRQKKKNNGNSENNKSTNATTTTSNGNKKEDDTTDKKEEQQEEGKGRKRKAETELTPSSADPPPPPQVGGHLRIGWSMRTGDLQAPVGYDKWSYGFRNLQGSKIHQSRREDNWGGEPWGPGDVVGCAILLDPPAASGGAGGGGANGNSNSANSGNKIRFFKNGNPMGQFVISKGKREGGAAFEDIQPGTYYPAVSSYLGGSVQVNFGPHFVYAPRKLPHGSKKLQPISSLQAPPLSETELMTRLKRKNIFSKGVGKGEPPEVKMQAFREAVLAESRVLQEAYQQHRRKHLQLVLEARQSRNLNTSDLQQDLDELDELEGKTTTTEDKMEVDEKEEEEKEKDEDEKESVKKEEPEEKEPAKEDNEKTSEGSEAKTEKMET